MRSGGQPATEAWLRLRCEATPDHLEGLMRQVDEALDRAGVHGDDAHDLRLVVEEACVNVMRHAWTDLQGRPELSLEIGPAQLGTAAALRVELSDHGRPFNPLAAAAPDLLMDAQDRPIGGLGIHLIRSLTDEQHYSRDDVHGNRLVLLKRLARKPAG